MPTKMEKALGWFLCTVSAEKHCPKWRDLIHFSRHRPVFTAYQLMGFPLPSVFHVCLSSGLCTGHRHRLESSSSDLLTAASFLSFSLSLNISTFMRAALKTHQELNHRIALFLIYLHLKGFIFLSVYIFCLSPLKFKLQRSLHELFSAVPPGYRYSVDSTCSGKPDASRLCSID